jgi:hypothetical protein
MRTTGEGGGSCEVPPAADGVELRLISHRSGSGIGGDGGGAENGGSGGSCARMGGAEIFVARKEWRDVGFALSLAFNPYNFGPS